MQQSIGLMPNPLMNSTVTGIVDAEDSFASTDEKRASPRTLRRRHVASKRNLTLLRSGDSFTVSFADEPPIANGTQAELDPPPGARKAWLDDVISKHKFVVLVFYRGFW